MLPSASDQHSVFFTGYDLMGSLREYVMSIVAASLLSGILIRLTRRSGSGEIIRMLCGVFMTIILIRPIAGKKQIAWDAIMPGIGLQAERISAEGTASADKIKRQFIKQRVETYILNRAEAMQADIEAAVSLGEDDIPVSVSISGSISPLNRSRLTQMIALELGIPKEQQEWIG